MHGHRFRRQVPFGQYIADFVCHTARLIIEIDGGQHERPSPDEAKRARFLEDQGYRILRFWNNRCCQTSKACVRSLPGSCGITPTLTRPHQGGGNALEPWIPSFAGMTNNFLILPG
jgi:very-short-patch-repair endonuclease